MKIICSDRVLRRKLSEKCRLRAVLGLLAALPLGAGLTAVGADSRPNILYCLADDYAWPHAGAYGDPVVKTPAFDTVARAGALLDFAFSAAPSCTPSRAAMLTGQAPHRLGEGGNLWSKLDSKHAVYPELLEKAGYVVGFTRKGWGPGNFKAGGRERNPAGPHFKDFAAFLETVPDNKPFCFWFGSQDPHRTYDPGSGLRAGLDPKKVVVPPFWPDTPEVRSDILDYYLEVQRFDSEVGELLRQLDKAGRRANTLVAISGDNGWPFPRAKANLYDAGTRQPLAVCWPDRIQPRQVIKDFISLADLAPTFLEAAGLTPLPEMTGRSFLGLVTAKEKAGQRDWVFVERERHANVRRGDLGYPARAIRTREFLYIRNFAPERWPAGDPEEWVAVGPFGDVDGGPTKQFILDHRSEPSVAPHFRLCFDRRPAEELYDLQQDPWQTNNLAGMQAYARQQRELRTKLEEWMRVTADPRTNANTDLWDRAEYFGSGPAKSRKK